MITMKLAWAAAATAAAGVLGGGTAWADADCGKPTCFTHVYVDGGQLVAEWQSPITGPYTGGDHVQMAEGYDPNMGYDVRVQPDGTGHGSYRGIVAMPGEFYALRVRSCSNTGCGPWETDVFRAPDRPPPPEKVHLPYSNGPVNPYRCPACELAGN
jgi:hypothetical protein